MQQNQSVPLLERVGKLQFACSVVCGTPAIQTADTRAVQQTSDRRNTEKGVRYATVTEEERAERRQRGGGGV